MAAITETLKLPSFRYPSKDPDTYLDVNRTDSDYVDLGTHFWLGDVTKVNTVSAWVNPHDDSSSGSHTVIHAQRTDGNNSDVAVFLSGTTVAYWINNNGSGTTLVSPTKAILNRWNHVVWIMDHINETLTFVINGVADSQVLDITLSGGITQFDLFRVGWQHNNIWGDVYGDFGLANLKIYQDYALPVEEAQAQYIRGVNDYGYSDEVGLESSYHFNEGTGIVAIDALESSQNHGTLVGNGTQEDRWVNAAPRSYRETVLHDTPKAYWRLKELSGFEVQDETGNFGKLMQHFNAPLIGQDGPFPGTKSVEYSKASSHYSQMSPAVIGPDGQVGAYSGEFWININEDPPTTAMQLISQQNAGADESNFSMSLRGELNDELLLGEQPPADANLLTAASILTPGVWHHIVFTKDVAGSIREIYIDGILNVSDASPENDGGMDPMTIFRIGSWAGASFTDGNMSEVAVYDYKLSSKQIADHYLAAICTKTYVEWITESTPDGYFRLNDVGSPLVALDSSGNNKDGSWAGNPTLGVTGLITGGDTAAYFDGASHITMDSVGDFNITTQDFAVELWVRTSQTTGNKVFWDKRNNDGGRGYLIGMKNGLVTMSTKDSGDVNREFSGLIDISDGLPHHIVCNFFWAVTDEIWVDGVIDQTGSAIAGANSLTSTEPARLGWSNVGGTSFTYFQGTMDEVTFYNGSTLSSAEIRAHYVKGSQCGAIVSHYASTILESGPIGWYRLNETSGTDVFDSSGNGKTGAWNGTTNLGVAGLITGGDLAAIWNGSNAYVSIPGANFNIITEDFAIEMWIKTSQNTGNVILWDKRDSGNDAQGWMVGLMSGNAALFIKDAPTANTIITGSIAVADNAVHHLVFNYDRDGLGEVWVDGILDDSGSIAGHPSIGALSIPSRIGDNTVTSSFVNFNGTMDEVAFYKSKLLTPSEIADHYAAGR